MGQQTGNGIKDIEEGKEKNLTLGQNLLQICRKFADQCSINTVSLMVKSEHIALRCMWTLVTLLGLVLVIHGAYHLIIQYFSYPVKTSVEIRNAWDNFPAVTICNPRPVNLMMEALTSQPPETLMADPLVNPSLKEVATFIRQFQESKTVQAIIKDPGLTLTTAGLLSAQLNMSWLDDITIDVPDLVVSCKFSSRDCPKGVFVPHIYHDYLKCYTFKPSLVIASNYLAMPGAHSSLTLTLYTKGGVAVKPKHFDWDSYIAQTGIHIVIHDENIFPLVTDEGYDLTPGQTAVFSITPVGFERLPEPHGSCQDITFRSKSGGPYWSRAGDCLMGLFCDYVSSNCACKDIFSIAYDAENTTRGGELCTKLITDENLIDVFGGNLPTWRNMTKCILTARKEAMRHLWKKCELPCNDISYETHLNFIEWPPDEVSKEIMDEVIYKMESNYRKANQSHKWKYVREDIDRKMNASGGRMEEVARKVLLQVRVQLHKAYSMISKESPAYTGNELLGDLGGQLGLWLGVSAMAILELIPMMYDIAKAVANRL